jgi:GMP synthase-like glutamine amidotransferase
MTSPQRKDHKVRVIATAMTTVIGIELGQALLEHVLTGTVPKHGLRLAAPSAYIRIH